MHRADKRIPFLQDTPIKESDRHCRPDSLRELRNTDSQGNTEHFRFRDGQRCSSIQKTSAIPARSVKTGAADRQPPEGAEKDEKEDTALRRSGEAEAEHVPGGGRELRRTVRRERQLARHDRLDLRGVDRVE